MTKDGDWYPIDNGQTLGTVGSEKGTILRDDKNDRGARITLEKCGYPPFAITCGIYGLMAHTAFASTREEAEKQFVSMKTGIEEILRMLVNLSDSDTEARERIYKAVGKFVKEF
jgi:hypothetical protein